MARELRFPKEILFGIEKLARTRAKQEWEKHSKNPSRSPVKVDMAENVDYDPYDDDKKNRRRNAKRQALLDMCDRDNEKDHDQY